MNAHFFWAALPPYNDLIAGKMAALAMTSNDGLSRAYRRKYAGRKTLMVGRT